MHLSWRAAHVNRMTSDPTIEVRHANGTVEVRIQDGDDVSYVSLPREHVLAVRAALTPTAEPIPHSWDATLEQDVRLFLEHDPAGMFLPEDWHVGFRAAQSLLRRLTGLPNNPKSAIDRD